MDRVPQAQIQLTDRRLRSAFEDAQRRFFFEADIEHFRWQTANPYVSKTESELLSGLAIRAPDRVLEVGCGEGGNLVNIMRRTAAPALIVGADLFERKVAFARRQGVPGLFIAADVLALPFGDAVFDVVLCRDVLHHVEYPDAALREMARVTRGGGTIWLIEPNGRNPLIRALALLRPHERGLLRNSPGAVARAAGSVGIHFVEMRQPLPLFRLLLHYQVGLPALGHSSLVARAMDAIDAILRRLLPRRWWAYILVRVSR